MATYLVKYKSGDRPPSTREFQAESTSEVVAYCESRGMVVLKAFKMVADTTYTSQFNIYE